MTIRDLDVRYRRTFALYPAFDLGLDLEYTRQERVGVVQGYPDIQENINIYTLRGSVSRFVGPDKITLGGGVVYMAMPDTPYAAIDQRPRERLIREAWVDYGLYRPIVLPQLQYGTWAATRTYHRGVHLILAGALDDERYGTSIIHRDSAGVTLSFKGIGRWSVLLGESYISDTTTVFQTEDPSYANAQLRSQLKVAAMLVDEETTPGLPDSALSSMWVALSVRHDLSVRGPAYYANARAGVELWAKLFSPGLRGTSFLLSGGADAEYFYNLSKAVAMAHIDVRMGWPSFVPIPGYF